MKKILSVVGARPQFIKAAVVSRQLRKWYQEILVHTGQHYDYNMSAIFFEELDIPKPDINLGISGGNHGKMTGEMLIALEEVFEREKPAFVALYGDTNSTLAAALAAVKLHIPVVHVEAGNRFGTLDNPEEVNRIVTDHVSTLLLSCTASAKAFLDREGLGEKSFVVGDPMYDAFSYYSNKVKEDPPERLLSIEGGPLEYKLPSRFFYLTCHRQENTEKEDNLMEILSAMNALPYPCIYPVHPRNQKQVQRCRENHSLPNIVFCQPVGYLMSVFLINHCEKVVTDSGGLQREAYFAKKPCLTVLDFVVWPETMLNHRNQLTRPDCQEILQKLETPVTFAEHDLAFGDGHASEKIVECIQTKFG